MTLTVGAAGVYTLAATNVASKVIGGGRAQLTKTRPAAAMYHAGRQTDSWMGWDAPRRCQRLVPLGAACCASRHPQCYTRKLGPMSAVELRRDTNTGFDPVTIQLV